MSAPRSMSLAGAIVRTARPRQWSKNVLVFAAPGAAGVLTHGHAVRDSALAFIAFCAAASGTYFLNDALDVEADRAHPDKCRRPIAAGFLSVPLAMVIAGVLMAASIVGPLVARRGQLGLVVGLYVAITLAYSLWLKHQPLFDLAAVAAGFVLRAIAGGVAASVPLSNWFLIVASSGSMLMVSGKRHAESLALGDTRGEHRATLDAYTLSFLRYVRSVSSSVAMTGYCFWAFEKASLNGRGAIWFELSAVPFALGILRYAMLLDAGQGGAPEDVVLGDRVLQVFGVALVAMFGIGLYLA